MNQLRFSSALLPGWFAIGLFLLASSLLPAAPEERDWTDRQGRQLRGSLHAIHPEGIVVLLAKDRRPVTIARQLLSTEDQRYVEIWEELGFGRELPRWPAELSPLLNFTPRLESAGRSGEWIYTTPNYRFHCDVELAPSLIKEYSLAFEGTLHAVRKLPLYLDPKPPQDKFTVRLFSQRESYLRAGGPQGTAGVYLVRTREILVPMESLGVRSVGSRVAIDRRSYDSGTLVHEITHQVMHDWLDVLPVWFVEGFAEYMAAVPFDGGRFSFRDVHQGVLRRLVEEHRIAKTRSGAFEVDLAPPDQIMNLTHKQWSAAVASGQNAALNYRSAMMLVYFFIHHDENEDGATLASYLQQARAGQEEMQSFVASYNEAVSHYNASLEEYNQSVTAYNQDLLRFRQAVLAYNSRVRAYNLQLEAGTPESKLIDVGEEPGPPPTPPRKPEMPAILAQGDPSGGVIDLGEAERKARDALLQTRTPVELWRRMAASFAEHQLLLRPVSTLPGQSLADYGDLFPATPGK